MKVRWTPTSLRLRITPSELAALERNESIEEALLLPGGGWRVIVLPSDTAATALEADAATLRLRLAAQDRDTLAGPETEGVYFSQPGAQEGERLRFYIEKDFPCAHPRAVEAAEPTTETFNAPEGFTDRKNTEPGSQ